MADFLVVDVGGANLAVEIDTDGASLTYDQAGTAIEDADDGSSLVSVAFATRRSATFKSKWMTTEEFVALKAAAQWPKSITVGGHFLRTTTPNTTPQTMTARVNITQADYFADDDDFLHVAQIAIQETL